MVERGFRELAGSDDDRARYVAENTRGWLGVFSGLAELRERTAA